MNLDSYQSLIDGTWSKKWNEYQIPLLPKHRIKHTEDKIFCTCGAGPLESIDAWAHHATHRRYMGTERA